MAAPASTTNGIGSEPVRTKAVVVTTGLTVTTGAAVEPTGGSVGGTVGGRVTGGAVEGGRVGGGLVGGAVDGGLVGGALVGGADVGGVVLEEVVELTSGPEAAQLDSAITTSTTPSRPPRPGRTVMWRARTLMLVLPGALVTVCSFRTMLRMPGSSTVVLGSGDWISGLPPRTAPMSSVNPVEPSPFDVQPLSTASMVREPSPTTMSAALARLWAKAKCPVGSPAATPSPRVKPLSTPMLRRPMTLTGRDD